MTMIPLDLRLLWAKTQRGDGELYHPLICHLVDVGAVSRVMWQEVVPPPLRKRVAAGLGMANDATLIAWIEFLAATHDIGKASPGFQCKDKTRWEALRATALYRPLSPNDIGHGVVSALALRQLLPSEFDMPPQLARDVIAPAIGGHHGKLPENGLTSRARSSDIGGEASWSDVRRVQLLLLAELIGVPAGSAPKMCDAPTALVIAGLVSVADWIGSDEHYFSYRSADINGDFDLAAYRAEALATARDALNALGWLDWTAAPPERTFAELFPSIAVPRPVQTEIVELPGVNDGPGIVIVELPMGEGKTEAALYLADRWASRLGQRGAYIGMPTMATSNQMFSRVHDYLSGRFPEGVTNLQLLHSQAAVSAELEALREAGTRLEVEPRRVYDGDGQPTAEGQVIAREWFTRRKRGLLAPFGVGTVDQSLLAALRTRHVFVRLFGLAGKTVIFDEVHAYDVYMSRLFAQLLRWLGALGTSVIVLSATLPRARRDELLRAYAHGAGSESDADALDAPYPRLSWATADGIGAKSVTASEAARRELAVEWIDADFAARLSAALGDGGCAAVICNTVRRAQEVYQALKPYFPQTADDGDPELDLFHARFLFGERDAREKRALRRFGKPGGTVTDEQGNELTVRRPRRAVLVATQVIEQSLDLDFDRLISEVAPIDLLLQRTGRMHRHERERLPGLDQPTLWLITPEIDEHGLPQFGRGNEYVYQRHTLLRTWLALEGPHTTNRRVAIPAGVEGLIDTVYQDSPPPAGLSPALQEDWIDSAAKAEEQRLDDSAEAVVRLMLPPSDSAPLWEFTADMREEDADDKPQALQALTRLGGPILPVILLYDTPHGPALDPEGAEVIRRGDAPDLEVARKLLRRAVGVTDYGVIRGLRESSAPSGWQRSGLLSRHKLVLLDGAHSTVINERRLRLDAELGLVIESAKGEEA